jgi:ribosomal protein L37AE/L43A
MNTCLICGDMQDARHYAGYNICTACADVMEDIMGEYFVRTIWRSEPKAHEGYLSYLDRTTRYISDYKKLTRKSGQYTMNVSSRIPDAMQSNSGHPSRQRYFEYMQKVLDWLAKTPEFYHYYFKEYYVCPSCGSSIFEKYVRHNIGEWLVVSCSNCDTVIKKYYSPKQA